MYQTAQMIGAAAAVMAPVNAGATVNAAPKPWAARACTHSVGTKNSTYPMVAKAAACREPIRALGVMRSRFAALQRLSDGWDGPASRAPDHAAIALAARMLDHALKATRYLESPLIVPAADGSIQAEWYSAEHRFEMYFDADGEIAAWSENRGTGVEMEEDGIAAFQLLIDWTAARDDDHLYAA